MLATAAREAERAKTTGALEALKSQLAEREVGEQADSLEYYKLFRSIGLLEVARGGFSSGVEHLLSAVDLMPTSGVPVADQIATFADLGVAQSQQRALASAGKSLSRARRELDQLAAGNLQKAIALAHANEFPLKRLEAESKLLQLYFLARALDFALIDPAIGKHTAAVQQLRDSPQKLSLLITAGSLLQEYAQRIGEDTPQSLRKLGFDCLTQALRLAESLGDTRMLSYANGLLGGTYADAERYEEAQQLTAAALKLAHNANAQDAVFRWEWQAGRLLRARGAPTDAQQALGRAVTALEQVRKSSPAGTRNFFSRWVAPLYRENAELLVANSVAEASLDSQQLMLTRARTSLESLKRAEIEDYFSRECFDNSAVRSSDALTTNVAVIFPVIHDSRLDLLVEAGGQLRRFSSAVTASELGLKASQLRTALASVNANNRHLDPAKELYNWVVRPMLEYLREQKVDTLVFVPDGKLRSIPLSVLFDGEQYLLQQFAVVSSLSAEMPSGMASASSSVTALSGGISERVGRFDPLANVIAEIDAIGQQLNLAGQAGSAFLNKDFSLGRVTQELMAPDYTIVHFATHGEFSANFESSFVLTYDGNLTLSQLQSSLQSRQQMLGQSLDLLVLSACETAAGDDRATLGLAGMAVQSGVRSVLGTLWKVLDASSVALMDAFYAELLVEKTSKAESLRSAQLALLESDKYAHPRYWSPYILLGDWR